jgi:hypothetical protein
MSFVLTTALAAGVLLAAVTAYFRFRLFALKGVEVTSGECNINSFSRS